MACDQDILDLLKPNAQNKDGEKYLCEYLFLFRKAIRDMERMVCPTDDIFLLRFLRTKKFNVEESVKLLHLYFDMKRLHSDLMQICITTLKPIYDSKSFVVIKQRDSEGRKILYFRTAKWNPMHIHYEQLLVAGFFIFEEMTRSEETQKNGIVIILDSDQLTFNQTRQIVMQLTFAKIRKLAYCLQGTYPFLFKGLHFVNSPFMFDVSFAAIKFFLKEKLKKRTHLHGKDMKSLHKFLSPEILPYSLGGMNSIENVEDTILMQSMFDKEDYYKRLHHYYGYQEN